MPYCVVKGCQSNGKRYDPSTTMHTFPKDLHLIKRWLVQMPLEEEEVESLLHKIKDGKSLDSFRMCSRHFSPDSYYITKAGKKRLHKLALPSDFTEDSKISRASDSVRIPPHKIRCLRKKKECPTCRRPITETQGKVDIGVQTEGLYPGNESTPPDSNDHLNLRYQSMAPNSKHSLYQRHNITPPDTKGDLHQRHNSTPPGSKADLYQHHDSTPLDNKDGLYQHHDSTPLDNKDGLHQRHDSTPPDTKDGLHQEHDSTSPYTKDSLHQGHDSTPPDNKADLYQHHDSTPLDNKDCLHQRHDSMPPDTKDHFYPGYNLTPPDSKDGIIDSIKNTRTILPLISVKQENDV